MGDTYGGSGIISQRPTTASPIEKVQLPAATPGAANAGDGQAALRMGESYDPAFLAGTRVPGNRGDAATAAQWYLRALELGILEAEVLFKAVTATGGYTVR